MTRKFKIFDIVMSIAAVVIAALLIFLTIFMIGWIIGIEKMESLEKFMSASSGVMISLLIIAGAALALSFLVMFVCWLCKDEGMMILPFEVPVGEEKYSGRGLSQLLTAELLRISRIHDPDVKYKGITSIESEMLNMPELAPTSENLTYTVSQLGPVGLGTTSIHIGPLIAILKKLWPKGDNGQVISGSLQRYGSVISLVACLEHKEISAWEASCEIEGHSRKSDECIPELAKDISYKIIHDFRREEISSKTWQGFKHFTEALDAYYQYNLTGFLDHLERARTECLKAANSETGYEKLFEMSYNLGMAYVDEKELCKAEELLFLAYEIKPDDKLAPFGMGYLYGIQGSYQKALDYFETTIVTDRNFAVAWFDKGVILNYLERYEDALEAFEKGIELDPMNAKFYIGKGESLVFLERYEEALDAHEKGIELDPKDARYWNCKGNALGFLERYGDAVEIFEKAIELDPKNAKAWHNYGAVLNKLERYEKALEALDKAIELDPKEARYWNSKGESLIFLKRYDDALEAYEKAIKLNPKEARYWNSKGNALGFLERYEEALETFEKMIELDPKNAKAWHNYGAALNELERYEGSLQAFDKAVELDPKDARYWHSKGNALGFLKRYDDALEAFEKAIELEPREARYWNCKGDALCFLKRYEDAFEAFDKAIELDPKNIEFWNDKGLATFNLKLYEDALEAFEKVIELDPKNADAWYNKGTTLYNLDRTEETIKAYEKAAELGLKTLTFYVTLARLYRKHSQETESIKACKHARSFVEKEGEYNRACFEAVCGSPDAAINLLRTALEKKEQTADWARQDTDFEFIRDDPRFKALLDEFSTDGKKGPE